MLNESRSIRHVERILYLKKLRSIGTLSAAQLAVVAEYVNESFFPKGSVLLREGEPTGAIHFVVEGKVHLSRGGRNLGHAGPGAAVGGLGLLARDEEGVHAVAEADTLTLELDSDGVREVFEDHFAILHHIIRDTCGQLVRALSKGTREIRLPSSHRMPQAPATRELDLVERIFFLRQAAPFAHSSIDALAELSRGLVEVRYDAGTSLWPRGDPAKSVLMIVSGKVACTPADPRRRFQLGAGAPLGAIESVAVLPRWYDAVTATGVIALSADVEGLIDVFEDHFGMAMDYLAVVSQWLLSVLETRVAEPQGLQEFYGCDEESLAVSDAGAKKGT